MYKLLVFTLCAAAFFVFVQASSNPYDKSMEVCKDGFNELGQYCSCGGKACAPLEFCNSMTPGLSGGGAVIGLEDFYYNVCPMIPTIGVPENESWPYIYGYNEYYESPRNETKTKCICNNRWACKEGYEICSEFLGCIPRFDVIYNRNTSQYEKSPKQGYKGWIIFENPDSIIEETIKNNWELYGKTTDDYLNNNGWKYFDLSQDTCDSVGLAVDNSAGFKVPKAWTSTDTPRNPEPIKVARHQRHEVQSKKFGSNKQHHDIGGVKQIVNGKTHRRNLGDLNNQKKKWGPNTLFQDYMEYQWRCTDFDYAENALYSSGLIERYGLGFLTKTISSSNLVARGSNYHKSGLLRTSRLTRSVQESRVSQNSKFDKFPYTDTPYEHARDSKAKKRATTGTIFKIFVMPDTMDETNHFKTTIPGTPDTIGYNPIRELYSNSDWKKKKMVVANVKGCNKRPTSKSLDKTEGEPFDLQGTCHDMWLVYGDPSQYGGSASSYFPRTNEPFWVLMYRQGDFSNIEGIRSSAVVLSHNLYPRYGKGKVQQASSCRLGINPSDKVLTNDQWTRLVADYAPEYRIKEICDRIFRKHKTISNCYGSYGCLKSPYHKDTDDRKEYWGKHGYHKHVLDAVKISGKCIGRRNEWKASRMGPSGPHSKGSKTIKVDEGFTYSSNKGMGYNDVWHYESSDGTFIMHSPIHVGGTHAYNSYKGGHHWALETTSSTVTGWPNMKYHMGEKAYTSGKKCTYSKCPEIPKYVWKTYTVWDDYEMKYHKTLLEGKGSYGSDISKSDYKAWWWSSICGYYEGKCGWKYDQKAISLHSGASGSDRPNRYVFDSATRFQYTEGPTIHAVYNWQSFTLEDDLKSGTIVPAPTNPMVYYLPMNENVPSTASQMCHYGTKMAWWAARDADDIFIEGRTQKQIFDSEYWKLSKSRTKKRQFVLRGDSFSFCRNDEETDEKCLCGKRSCNPGQWCYYRHFTSETWKGDSFDLVGWCADRKLIPCEAVDPKLPFTASTKDIKPRDDDCICGTHAIDDSKPITIDNIQPRWVYIADGPYITCNFDLNNYGQGHIVLDVPILGPPCQKSYGVYPNQRRCSCYSTKKGFLTAQDAMEHVFWSDFQTGQYCFRDEGRIEHVAFALVTDGYCRTYDPYEGKTLGPWQIVNNPNQCLEGSNRIDDKTLTINPKVRFTRSKHDQPGCSWDKGGWYLLFNDYLHENSNYDDPTDVNYVIPCEDTYAEDATRSGCICQLRGERCKDVHGQNPLDANTMPDNDICLCGQKKCQADSYCYEKLSGCESSNSFLCNYNSDDHMCWPDNAQKIVTKLGIRRNRVYLVEDVETTPQMTPVCPEGADNDAINNFAENGLAAPQQCICGDAFKVLPTICEAGEYCHHRLNICYKEKQTLCPTNVYNTQHDECLCGLKKNRPAHLMNVYDELEEATQEPHDQAKFFDTVYCERSQLCVLRDYADSLEPDAMCLSGPIDPCPDYPTQISTTVCRCSPKLIGKEGQYCYKGELRDEKFPYCRDRFSSGSLDNPVLTNCYCPNAAGTRGQLILDDDGKYCDFRNRLPTCGESSDMTCGSVQNIPSIDCDFAEAATATCKCNGKLQWVACTTGEYCGMIEGGLPQCFNEHIEICDPTLSCRESLERSDTCFCDGIQTQPTSICTGAGIVKDPVCDVYESPYDVQKQDVYFHKFNVQQFGTVQSVINIETEVYGERYDPLAYPTGPNQYNLKQDAPDWCDPLLAFDNPDHYDCLYLPTKADIDAEVSIRIEWSTENTYLIPGDSTVDLITSVDDVSTETSNCQAYRVTVGANGYTAKWEADTTHNGQDISTVLDNIQCPEGTCFARIDSDDTCAPTPDCFKPQYESCELFGTSKRYFTWKKWKDVYELDNDLEITDYAAHHEKAFIIDDTKYIETGTFTKNDLLDFSTEILMCTLEDIATKSAEPLYLIAEGTTAPHAFFKAFDGECNGRELLMYEGNGDNTGTANEQRNRCAKACSERKPSLSSSSWEDVDDADEEILGFIVAPSTGRCWCEVADSKTCSRSLNTFDRYDFVDPFFSWTEVDLEDRRSSVKVPVTEEGEHLLTCVIGLFSADVLQRKDPTPLYVEILERRFMGGNPSLTHFEPAAIAVDVKAVAGTGDASCTSLNNEENTGWMPIHQSFHRNPCNLLLDRSNTYQFSYDIDNIDRIEDMSIEYTESEQTCVLERVYAPNVEIDNEIAAGSCKYLRPLPEGWWSPRLPKGHKLSHSDPAQECAKRCYAAYKSKAFTLKTSHGVPTWLESHVGFESSGFVDVYAGSTFWDKFNTLRQQWQAIPQPTRLDQCACAYDACSEVENIANIMPLYKTKGVDPCFETFFPIFFGLSDEPDQQKLYFEKAFVRENICQVGNAQDRFSRNYYKSYRIKVNELSVMSPHITSIKTHALNSKGHLASDNGGITLLPVNYKGWSAQYHFSNNIPKCAGDCDRDSHCAAGLKCFQRSFGEQVPGCQAGGHRALDLCYDPNDIGKPEIQQISVDGFSEIIDDQKTYLAQICIKYVPWCPVITENTRIEDINENMFECMCATEAKREDWDPNNPFWVYERKKIYKNEPKYCLQEPDTKKVIIDKKPCSAYNKTIEWSLDFDKNSLNNFDVQNLQECYCGGDNGAYCGETEFCFGDQNERVCQSLNQIIDKDIPIRVIEEGKCSDMAGWEPVYDPLFCYAQRQVLLRPHGYEISTSSPQHAYDGYPDISLLDDVKYSRLGDLQDKHKADELYYGLTFEEGCSISYISDVDDNVPFYKNEHLAPIKDPITGEFVSISHRKYTGSWGDGCAIPSLAEWYFETTPQRYSTAYYSCEKPARISFWEEYFVKKNAFGTTRALPKLHSGDVNRLLGLYAKFGKEDFSVGEQTLEVNTRNVENMQFSQIEDIPVEVYNIVYKQKKLCKLDRPLCSDVVAGNAYDSKYCINKDGNVVDAGALKIPSGAINAALIQSGTCAQHEFNSIESAEQCLARAAELGIPKYVLITSGTCASNGYSKVSNARECDQAAIDMDIISPSPSTGYTAIHNRWAFGSTYSNCHVYGSYVYWNTNQGTGGCETRSCICKIDINIVTETSVATPYKPVADDGSNEYHKVFEGGYPSPQYLGCYQDDATRDFCCGPRAYGYTKETCATACEGYEYFALQNNGWCQCDNTFSTPSSSYPKIANDKCGSNQLGGPYTNAVFRQQTHGDTLIRLYNEYAVFQKDKHYCRVSSSSSNLAPFSYTTKIVSTNEECAKHCFSVFPSATRIFASWRAGHPAADKTCYCHKLDQIDHCANEQWHIYTSGSNAAYTYHLLDMRKLSSKINSKQDVNDKCAAYCAGAKGFITSTSGECFCSQTTPHFSIKHSDDSYETFSFGGPPEYRKIVNNGYIRHYYASDVSYHYFRIYAGCGYSPSRSWDTNTYPDESDVCDANEEKRTRECANACQLRGSIEGYPLKGFLVNRDTGNCYCSVKRAYEGEVITSSGWDSYDFVADKVETNPSSCPDDFFFQNGVCTRLVGRNQDYYCNGGAWGTGKFVFLDIDYGLDEKDCANLCSQYAVDNLLGTVTPGHILRHYASNRDYGSAQRCFCHKLVYAPEGHCENIGNIVPNTWYSTVVIDTVIPDTGDYTGISNQIANKRCAHKCTGEDGFAITNDGKCLCQRDGFSTSSYVEPGSFQRFEINPSLEYEENHVNYIKIGDGYCSDWKYLPEGGYPGFLSKSSPLFSTDRTRECMNRCLDAYPDSEAFYIRASDNKCGCSSGQCQSTKGTATSYTSYKIVKCLGEWKAPKYSFKYQGSCKNFVTSVDECEYAAQQLGLPDTIMESSSHRNINHPGLPYGCTQKPIGKILYMNWNGNARRNTETCGTAGYPCICRDEPVTCPAGTYAYHSGSHCCRVNSDKNGQPLQYHHTNCLDNNYIECPAGAFDGACADEKNFCSIKNGNVDFVLNKQHLSVQLDSNQVYKTELVNYLDKWATPAQKSVVAILSQDNSLTQDEKVANCRDSCIHGVEAECSKEPRCKPGEVCYDVTGVVKQNQGIVMNPKGHPMRYDANSLIFGGAEGQWFKMTKTNLLGNMMETRYISSTSVSVIEQLTIAKWDSVSDRSHTDVLYKTSCIYNRYCVEDVNFCQPDPRPVKPLMCMENWKGFYGRWGCAGATNSDGSWSHTYCTGRHASAHEKNDYFKTCCEYKDDVGCVEKEWRTETWQDMLESQYFSKYVGDGYCLPDAWNVNKFNADFKTCEGRCAATPNCNVFAWIDANDDSRVSTSQCIINTDSTCLNSADGSNNYPWKRFKLMKRPSGKYYEISEGLCSDSGGENIETEAECTEAAHYVKDAYCTKDGFENINGGGCRFSGYSMDKADRPSGCFWYSDSQNELAWFNTNINSVKAGNGRKSICKKRVHGFVLEDDGKCTCTTGSTNQHYNYKPIRYHYRCKWLADPTGTVDSSNYVPFLASSDPLASTDRAQECANRCNADGYTHFMTNGVGRCKCAQDDCSEVVAQTDAKSYEITTCGNFYEIESEILNSDELPSGCSVAGSKLTFNPFVNAIECDATNNCICEEEEFTVECPANEFPLDETKSLDFCRCNGEELCSSDYTPFCLTNGKCVKNGKCIHGEKLLAQCEGKAGWLRHPVDQRENDICLDWFASNTEKTRPSGGVTACGILKCPRNHIYDESLNACSDENKETFTMVAKLMEKTCAEVSDVQPRGHYDCQQYNLRKDSKFIKFENKRSVNLPYGCSAISYVKDNVIEYKDAIFNVYDSRQTCSEKTPCFCPVKDIPVCPDHSIVSEICVCGHENTIVTPGGMCRNKQPYPTCFDTEQDVQLNWACVCGDQLVVSKTFCSITEFEANIMQFSKYGADFEPLADTCHYQYSDIYVHVPRLPNRDADILGLPNPHDQDISDIIRKSGTRSVTELSLENLMHDLNDLSRSIKYANDSYTLGTKNFSFAGIYNDKGLFCKGRACFFGLNGNYTAQLVIQSFECKSNHHMVTDTFIGSLQDCADLCGRTKYCKLFSYNEDDQTCKLEKAKDTECKEGWIPSDCDTYKVQYEFEDNVDDGQRQCYDTLQRDKECKDYIEIEDIHGHVIHLGSENNDFKDPEQYDIKGLYHKEDAKSVHYFVGQFGTKNCYEDPTIVCGIGKTK